MRSILLQFSVTTVLIVLHTYVIVLQDFRSPWNAAWWFGVPTITAIIANRTAGKRALMGPPLITWSLATMCLTGEMLGGGP